MRTFSVVVAVAGLLCGLAAPVVAQPPQSATTNMEILAQKLKADKKLLVAQTVGLTDAEGMAFWPIYDAYQAELAKINERLKAGIDAYAKDYNANTAFWPIYDAYQAELAKINERLKAGIDAYAKDYNANTMTDAKASALLTEMIAIEEALVGLKKTCAAKLNGVIPATKIARYIQVENKVRAQVNYELAAGIPFVK